MLVDISSAAAATVVDWALVSSAPLASCVAVAESWVEVLANWPALRVRPRNTSCRFWHMLLTAAAILREGAVDRCGVLVGRGHVVVLREIAIGDRAQDVRDLRRLRRLGRPRSWRCEPSCERLQSSAR